MKKLIKTVREFFENLDWPWLSWVTQYRSEVFSGLKYGLSFLLTLATMSTTGQFSYVWIGLVELLIIVIATNLCFAIHKRLAYWVNALLIFLYNLEQIILIFGGTYLTLVMLSNLDSWEALSGKFLIYFSLIIPVLIVNFLPVVEIKVDYRYQFLYAFILVSWGLVAVQTGRVPGSPFQNYIILYQEKKEQDAINERIKKKSLEMVAKFYQEDVADGVSKPSSLPKSPNVILIFTEGLSQSIINDDRNLMPNIKELQSKSLNFKNYYNHTFATYAGLSGQLYSGYQLKNHDKNYLVSLQSLLKDQGYRTDFVNTEPNNPEFTTYLENFEFDSLVSQKVEGTMADKDAYSLLLKTAKKRAKESSPFFLSMYTFGTHVSLDSPNKKFGDGKDPMLNKFYDLDYWFGNFIKEFNKSDLAEDTILVFTTDHATYVDSSYQATFGKNRQVGSLDKVPFFIYYKGVEAETVDAAGRNSLDMTPTVLDFLDVSAENYFLGSSLFAQPRTDFNRIYYSELNYFETTAEKIVEITADAEKSLQAEIENYFAAKIYNSQE